MLNHSSNTPCATNVLLDGVINCSGTAQYIFVEYTGYQGSQNKMFIANMRAYAEKEVG